MTQLVAYAIVAVCGIGVLALCVAALRAQGAASRSTIAEMEARHARERADEERMLADYRVELGAT